MWIIYSLGASMLWGLMYVLSEQVYKKIAVTTAIGITCLITSIFMILYANQAGFLKRDIKILSNSPNLLLLFLITILVFILADLMIALSISNKNATLAGLIEISYPVFIALFAYFLYSENSINTTTLIGASLIFSGVFTIYHFNR